MKRIAMLLFVLVVFGASGQVSYWWDGMLRKPDAIQSQAYWIWPGSNIVFTYASNHFVINSTGGGASTNIGTNCFTFTAGPGLTVITSGAPCINVQYQTIGNLSNWMLLPTNAFEQACANLSAWCGIATNGYISGVIATQSFQAACANLSNWCLLTTNSMASTNWVQGTVSNGLWAVTTNWVFQSTNTLSQIWGATTNLIQGVTSNALWSAIGGGGSPQTNISYVAVTNSPWFGTNGSVNAMSNAFLMGGDGRLVLGTNNKTASAVNYAVFGTAVPAKLTVYGDIAIANEVSNTVFMYTQRTNFLQASANADNGSLVLTNNSAGSWPAAMAIVNKSSKQTGAAVKNPTCYYSYGVDSADNGTHDFFIFDQTAGAFVLASDSSQRMGVKLRLPNFQLDVAGDINTTNGQFRMNGQPLTNIVWTNTFLPASNLVVNLSNNVPNMITNYVQGTVSNGVYGTGWHTNGNTIGTTKAFIGTLDNQGFEIRVNNTTTVVVTNGGLAVGTLVTNSGSQANAFGQNTSASAPSAFAAGLRAKAEQQVCFAAGQDVRAAGIASFAVGRQNTSSGDFSFSAGLQNTASGEGTFAVGEGSSAIGFASLAAGTIAVANNDGSFVWSDSNGSGFTDSEANQFVVGADGGANFWLTGAGGSHSFRIDGLAGTNGSFISLTGPSTYGKVDVHKGIITNITSVLYTNVFGCMALTNSGQHLLLTVNTYHTITNYHYSAANGFDFNKVNGTMTNTLAGYYRVGLSVSATNTANDQVECDFATNDVPTDIIAAHWSTFNTSGKGVNGSASGIIYLPSNTRCSLQIKNVNSTTMDFSHCQFTIGTP